MGVQKESVEGIEIAQYSLETLQKEAAPLERGIQEDLVGIWKNTVCFIRKKPCVL